MKIAVCVKYVAVLGLEVEFARDERDVDQDFVDRVLNEWDAFAMEEALRTRERLGGAGEVVAFTVGDGAADDCLRRCLAMGADRAVRVATVGESVLDPIAVARLLADAIKSERPDLVLTGVQSSDSVQGATGTALAEFLGLARVTVAKNLELDPGSRKAVVHRELEGGLVDVVEVDLPALITIQTGINEPRYVTFRAIRDAEREEIAVTEGDPALAWGYRVRRMYPPPKRHGAEMLVGAPAEIARRIAEIVEERMA